MSARIMVINDNQEILELFDDLLRGDGYEPVLYSEAFSDLDEVEKVEPDLIILDYIFGGEKAGWQMLQKLKMRRSTANIPIVVCTAAVQAVREIEGYLEMKGIRLVAKPFDIDDLLTGVREALRLRSDAASLRETPQDQPKEQKTE
ncbi:MAG TPA: response regulator [Ktedonobacterales bacterium]